MNFPNERVEKQGTNWPIFWLQAVKSLKYTGIATGIVPLFFILLNPDFRSENYLEEMLFSTRIGFQIALCYWVGTTIIYLFLYCLRPHLMMVVKKSMTLQAIKGLSLMLIGLSLTSLLEPRLTGREFGLQSVSTGLLIGGVTFLLLLFYVGYRQTREHNLTLQAETAESRYHVLTNQMQPHFLFNSLNALTELIETDLSEAKDATHQLSELYRLILQASKSPTSPLDIEMDIVKKYLAMEKLRFGSRLKFNLKMPVRSEGVFLPSLILQTLVENALKHGISNLLEGGEVNVEVKPEMEGYRASVENTGEWRERTSPSGTGLTNSMKRLELLYPMKHDFTVKNEHGMTTVSFWFSGDCYGN